MQCVVTSPPYWGLRKYDGEQELVWGGRKNCRHDWTLAGKRGAHPDRSIVGKDANGSGKFAPGPREQAAKVARGEEVQFGNTCKCSAWRGGYGLEPTVEMYVEHTVEILREIRRVLRKDGVCFWNIGDSFCASPKGSNKGWDKSGLTSRKDGSRAIEEAQRGSLSKPGWPPSNGLKPKDLCLVPFRVALAAQADGWWVRSVVIWSKVNPMPESITDRPTTAHEYVLMLTKSAKYFWDGDAVREPYLGGSLSRYKTPMQDVESQNRQPGRERVRENRLRQPNPGGRNLRSVWTFSSQPYPDAHFATFPEELPRRCIAAATSERGACAECGAPWERIVKKEIRFESGSGKAGNPPNGKNEGNEQALSGKYDTRMGPVVDATTIGWKPGCKCGGYWVRSTTSKRLQRKWYRDRWQRKLESLWPSKPCLVFDPFAGSGTVGEVAFKMGRRFVLADLAYQEQQWERIPPMAFLMSGGPR